MPKLVLLLSLLLLLQESLSLRCKRCVDFSDENCTNLEEETCPTAASTSEPFCVTFIYEDGKTSKRVTEKKCAYKYKNEEYKCLTGGRADAIIACKTCTEDLCNSSAPQAGSLAVVGVAVALIFARLV